MSAMVVFSSSPSSGRMTMSTFYLLAQVVPFYLLGSSVIFLFHEGCHAVACCYYRIPIRGAGLGIALAGLSYRYIRKPGEGRFYFKFWPHVDADRPEPGRSLLVIAAVGPLGSFICGLTTCLLVGTQLFDVEYLLAHSFQLGCAVGVFSWIANLWDCEIHGIPSDGRLIYASIRHLRAQTKAGV
jgi:hypothetical protein